MANTLYTAKAHVTGGRVDGHGRTSDGALEVDLRIAVRDGRSGRRHQPGGAVRGRLRRLLRGRPRRGRPARRRRRWATSRSSPRSRCSPTARAASSSKSGWTCHLPRSPSIDGRRSELVARRTQGVSLLQRHPRQHRGRAHRQRPGRSSSGRAAGLTARAFSGRACARTAGHPRLEGADQLADLRRGRRAARGRRAPPGASSPGAWRGSCRLPAPPSRRRPGRL